MHVHVGMRWRPVCTGIGMRMRMRMCMRMCMCMCMCVCVCIVHGMRDSMYEVIWPVKTQSMWTRERAR